MGFTREQIEGQIAAKIKKQALARGQAIDELMTGAVKGARNAESVVMLAQDALAGAKSDEEVAKLEELIANEGRLASLENDRIAILKQIIKEEEVELEL